VDRASSYAATHRRSLVDPDAFWRKRAALIDWQTPFLQVLDYGNPPFARWFVGGRTNLCHNAIDRHLSTRESQAALVFVSTETDVRKTYTYGELHAEVNTFAAILKAQGVGKGDRVLIYMPMIPEAVFAMLATVRIGAIHSVVFGGFAAASLATRIDDAKPKVMITADAGMRGGITSAGWTRGGGSRTACTGRGAGCAGPGAVRRTAVVRTGVAATRNRGASPGRPAGGALR